MPILPIGEKQIHYWVGRHHRWDDHRTVTFIHGAGGGLFTWSGQKGFLEKAFNPIILELPGHGESGGEGEQEIRRYAEQVYAFMEALNLSKTFLVGHSMGGAIVQTLALTHPQRIKGIVLMGTGARLRVLPSILEGIRTHFEETVKDITRLAYSKKASQELIEKGVNYLLQCPPGILYGDFLACDRFDLLNEVHQIQVPTLVLCGQDDQMTPVRYSETLHRLIKGSTLVVLAGAGHMVMMESPPAFNERIAEFLLNPISSVSRQSTEGKGG